MEVIKLNLCSLVHRHKGHLLHFGVASPLLILVSCLAPAGLLLLLLGAHHQASTPLSLRPGIGCRELRRLQEHATSVKCHPLLHHPVLCDIRSRSSVQHARIAAATGRFLRSEAASHQGQPGAGQH